MLEEERLIAALVAEGLPTDAGSRADVRRWSNGPGDTYAEHAHGYDKVVLATEGTITFVLADTRRSVELTAGERLDLPAGTRHAATVGPHGVACLELHLAAGSLATLRSSAATSSGASETATSPEA